MKAADRRGRGTRGQASILVAIFVAAALLVGVLRYLVLGDIPPAAKAVEGLVWGLGTLVVGMVLATLASATLGGADSAPSPRRRSAGSSRGVSAEELNAIESELPEQEKPEFGGVHGRPPEEMAEAIRKMAAGDGL